MIEIDEAYKALAETFAAIESKPAATEALASHAALGRVLAEAVACRDPSPPFDASAMDGIAFAYQQDSTAYRCIGTVAAGDVPNQLLPKPGECVRIMTGAPVPASADTVKMVEYVRFEDEMAILTEPAEANSHIRYKGENLKPGDPLYEIGQTVTPGLLSGLLSQGRRFVSVRAPLRVGIAATGNEVVDYRRPLQPGQIYNSNAQTVAAVLAREAVSIQQLGTFPDRLEETRACIEANTDLDLLILTGGVSMGNFDLVPEAAEQAGFRKVFHKIRMKPGKPLWFGVHPSGTMLFGLPGNPVSAVVGSLLYIKPMISALLSGTFRQPCWGDATTLGPMTNRGKLTFFQGVRAEPGPRGLAVTPLATSGSGDVLRFSNFETLVRLSAHSSMNSGDIVQVLLPF